MIHSPIKTQHEKFPRYPASVFSASRYSGFKSEKNLNCILSKLVILTVRVFLIVKGFKDIYTSIVVLGNLILLLEWFEYLKNGRKCHMSAKKKPIKDL